MWLLLSPLASVCLASLTSASFVGSLYARGGGAQRVMREDRDEPAVIRSRIAATASACAAAVAALYMLRWTPPEEAKLGPGPPLWTWLGFPSHSYLSAWSLPLLLTASLFLGPLLLLLLDALRWEHGPLRFVWSRWIALWQADSSRWQSLRNLVAAPLCEELMFRGVSLALLVGGGWGFRSCVLLSPLLFGLAHVHHLFSLTLAQGLGGRQAAMVVLFQLAYTTLFGAYASALFLRTGHMVAVVLVHTFCNLMGFPELHFLHPSHRLHGRRAAILAVFVAGIVVFSLALVPLTDERWLYSAGDTEGHTHVEGLHDSGSWLMHYQRMHQRGDMDKFVPTL